MAEELKEFEISVQHDCVEETTVKVMAKDRNEALQKARDLVNDGYNELEWSLTDFIGDNQYYVLDEGSESAVHEAEID